jgi:hypothetical protein
MTGMAWHPAGLHVPVTPVQATAVCSWVLIGGRVGPLSDLCARAEWTTTGAAVGEDTAASVLIDGWVEVDELNLVAVQSRMA